MVRLLRREYLLSYNNINAQAGTLIVAGLRNDEKHRIKFSR